MEAIDNKGVSYESQQKNLARKGRCYIPFAHNYLHLILSTPVLAIGYS